MVNFPSRKSEAITIMSRTLKIMLALALVGGVATFTTNTPGIGSHSISAAYSDDPNFLPSSSISSLNEVVIYKICLLFDNTKPQNMGNSIPVKLQLCDVNNNNISSANVQLTGKDVDGNPALLLNSETSNPGYHFRYVTLTNSHIFNLHIFNLQTTGLSTGTHYFSFYVGSDMTTLYKVSFIIK